VRVALAARSLVLAVATTLLVATAHGAEPPVPKPERYFNDWAGVVDAAAAQRMDDKLRAFDGSTSSQVVVAIFPKLPSASLEDFTFHTAEAWRVGRGKLDNGVVIFVFVADHRTRMEVGNGLGGALPDITARQILDDVAAPHFRTGDYAGGLDAAIDAVMSATRGEYKAAAPPRASGRESSGGSLVLFIVILLVFMWLQRRGGSRTYRRGGYYGGFWGGGFGGGGGWGGGGFGGGGGGGFSGGGGSFGGGGASGSW
jgi:uncharacterized protein